MSISCPNCRYDDCLESDRYCIKCGHRLARAGLREAECAATKRVYDSTMVHVRLGLVYMQNGKMDKAIASWKAALEMDPDNKEALALLKKHGDRADSSDTGKTKPIRVA